MGQHHANSKGSLSVELIFVLAILLLVYREGFVKVLMRYQKHLQALQLNRITYDGVSLWKD